MNKLVAALAFVALAFGLVGAAHAQALSAGEAEEAAETEFAEWAKPYGDMWRKCGESSIQSLTTLRTEFPTLAPNRSELSLLEAQQRHREYLDNPAGYGGSGILRTPLFYSDLNPPNQSLEEFVRGRKDRVRELTRLHCEMADEWVDLLERLRRNRTRQ